MKSSQRPIVKIEEIASQERNAIVGGPFGSDLVSKDYMPEGVPVIRGANMGKGRWIAGEFVFVSEEKADSLSANCAKPGDLIFTQRGTIGQVALVPKDGSDRYLISQSQMKLSVDRSKADELYLFYVFSTNEQQNYIQQHAIRTGVPHTNLSILRNTPVKLPPLPEQKAIAGVLSSLDAKIELNQRMNEELEGMAKLLYDYWFVQYDFPMSAAQAAALGKPHLQGRPYRASGGPMTYNETLKREIPAGWRAGQISELCHLNQSTWGNFNHPQTVNYLDLANAKEGIILGIKEYAWNQAPSRARRILTPGDTIIGMVRPANRSFAMVPRSATTITGSTGFAVLTPKSDIYREFNYLSLTSDSNIERLATVASGAAYPAVNPEVVAAHNMAIPDKQLIASFHEKVRSSYDLMENNEKQSQELTTLRDWLLPMLMNGQVTATNVPTSTAEVAHPSQLLPLSVGRAPTSPDHLFALLRDRGSLSSSEAQVATGLDPATLRGLFKTLIDQGLVRTEGQRRGMRYLLSK